MSDGPTRYLKTGLHLILSFGIIYHLFVIVVMANGSSYVGRYLNKAIVPYASTLGMNTTWNFFSPDPAHTMYLKFTIYFAENEGEPSREPLEVFMPSGKDEGVWDLGEKRRFYAMRYMIVYPGRIDGVLGPYLCKRYEGAEVIHIEHIIDPIPSLDLANIDSRELNELGARYDYINRDYRCSQVNDEVIL